MTWRSNYYCWGYCIFYTKFNTWVYDFLTSSIWKCSYDTPLYNYRTLSSKYHFLIHRHTCTFPRIYAYRASYFLNIFMYAPMIFCKYCLYNGWYPLSTYRNILYLCWNKREIHKYKRFETRAKNKKDSRVINNGLFLSVQ